MRMTDLQAGWAIVGNDGVRLGTVDSVGQNYIIASAATGKLYVPVSAIGNVEPELVRLNLAKHEAEQMGWEQEPRAADFPEPAEEDLHRHI